MSLIPQIPAQYRRLMQHVKPYRWRLAGGVLFGILYGPANVGVLSVVKKVWARFFEEVQQWSWWQALGVAMLLPGMMAVRGLCDFLGAYLMNWVGLRTVMDLRVKMFEHLQRLSLDFYSGARSGELMSRVTRQRMRMVRGRAISTPLIELVAGLGGAMVFIYAFYMGIEGSKLITFALGLFMLYAPVKKLSRVHLQIQETMAAADRIFQLL